MTPRLASVVSTHLKELNHVETQHSAHLVTAQVDSQAAASTKDFAGAKRNAFPVPGIEPGSFRFFNRVIG